MSLIGELLIEAGAIDRDQLSAGLAHQKQWGGRIGDVLLEKGFLDEVELYVALAKQSGLRLVSIRTLQIAPELLRSVSQATCETHTVFPLKIHERALYVAVDDGRNLQGIDALQAEARVRVQPMLSPTREIRWAIRRFYLGDPTQCPPPKEKQVIPDADDFKLTDASGRTLMKSMNEIRADAERRGEIARSQPPQQTQAQQQPPPPAPAANAPVTQAQWQQLMTAIDGTQNVLRFVIEVSIQKGLFTRDEYLHYLEQLKHGR